MFDPEKKPRLPGGAENILRDREAYFYPRSDEGGFTVQEAEELGWVVDLHHASRHAPGRGLVEVHSRDSDEGRYGVLQAIYDFENAEHRRAQARAREIYLRLVRVQRQQLQALEATKAAREEAPAPDPKHLDLSDEETVALNVAYEREGKARREAIKHAREALRISAELDAFGVLELPEAYITELREEG